LASVTSSLERRMSAARARGKRKLRNIVSYWEKPGDERLRPRARANAQNQAESAQADFASAPTPERLR
jgi:hypothetical protein